MINIGHVKHKAVGDITLEISNADEFIKRIKEINKEIPGTKAEKMKLWKIRVIGADKIPAKIQHLIDNTEGGPEPMHASEAESTESQEKGSNSPPQNFGDPAMHASAAPSVPMHASGETEKPKRRVVRRQS